MSIITDQLYDTSDMGLAIALVCSGQELVELEQQRMGKKVIFRFLPKGDIHTIALEYWNGTLRIDAKTFWNESKSLKARLYSLG